MTSLHLRPLDPSRPSPLIFQVPTQSVVPGADRREQRDFLRRQQRRLLMLMAPRGHQLKEGDPPPPPPEPGRTLLDMFGPKRFSFGPNTSFVNPMRQTAEGVADLFNLGPYHRLGDGDVLGLRRIAFVVGRVGTVAAVGKALGVQPPQFLVKASKPLDVGVAFANAFSATAADHDYDEGRITYRELQSIRASALLSLGQWLPAGKAAKLAEAAGLSKDFFDEMKAAQERLAPGAIRARGGIVRHGETTLVGERGPEIVRLPAGSDVIPAHRSRELLERAGAATAAAPGGQRELHVHQHLDGREIARSTVRNLDDDEQWGRA